MSIQRNTQADPSQPYLRGRGAQINPTSPYEKTVRDEQPLDWALVADEYQAELAQTQARIDQSVTYLQDYLRVPSLSLSKLVVVPNLVDSYYSGYGPQLNGTAYVDTGAWVTERLVANAVPYVSLRLTAR